MRGEDYGDVMVCTDCYFAHHYGCHEWEREATEQEVDKWQSGYYERELMGMEFVETPEGVMVKEWFSGESDYHCEGGRPLARLDGFDLSDNTCSNHYYGYKGPLDWHELEEAGIPCDHCDQASADDGLEDFSYRSCDGCGSHLGGSRSRLHLWKVEDAVQG